MKTITNITFLTLMVLLNACYDEAVVVEGPVGPRGAQGPQGIPGESGYAFEYTNVNFTAPGFEVFLPFPPDFEVLASDVVLTYLLWDVQEIDGVLVDVWRPVPQTIPTENGLLQYNFDFTTLDTRLFLDAAFPLRILGAADTDDWVARVVVVPARFWSGGRLSAAPSYAEVTQLLGLKSPERLRRSLPTRR